MSLKYATSIGTASHYCEAVVLESRAVPFGTALGWRILLEVRRGAQAMYNQFDKRGATTFLPCISPQP